MIFTDIKVLDSTKQPVVFLRQLWITQGIGKKVQLIGDNISSFYLAADPNANQIAYLIDDKLSLQDFESNSIQSIDFDPNGSGLSEGSDKTQSIFPYYEMTWRPGAGQIAFYNENRFLLLDINTGEACEVDLAGWAFTAHWSPNGRFLAVGRTNGALPVKYSDLAVLDVLTGKLYTPDLTLGLDAQFFVTDIAWAPDSRHLVTLGNGEEEQRGLYFIDFASGKSVHLLPEQSFGGGWWGSNLVWSPDGLKLLAACPTEEEERLCLILVQKNTIQ